ncbi:rod shape-determining protein [Paractinoplanes rishiriensis]|uniref:rod shape-determining protein n=1 Tax=Paractinoplanes rishiriensis TaxID=1050105 RepID=UPI0023B240C6|nr:rod shape-determining protein [Actinoplanes rishiriensis]
MRYGLALDLGTSTVRLWTPQADRVITEPAVLCRPRRGRQVAGRAALAAQAEGAAATWPVRGGVVRDYFACVHLLRLLTATIAVPSHTAFPVVVGVPATATARERSVLVAAVRRAVGGRVRAVQEPLAAALACRTDPGCGDLVVVDVGSGRTEVARIRGHSVVAAVRVDDAGPVDRIPAIAECVRRLDHPDDERRRLLLTGGGAAAPGVAARLAALTARSVTMPADPTLATLTGLRRLLAG